MTLAITVIAIVLTITTFIPANTRPVWWIRDFDFPRIQIAFLTLLTLSGSLFFYENSWHHWIINGLLATVLILQLRKILPFTLFYKQEVMATETLDNSRQLGIMVANVLMTNKQTKALLDMVETIKPDLLLTLESNAYWEEALSPLEKIYQHVIRCPQENLYGMHLYSRLELTDPQINFLIEDDIPSIHTGVILPSGEEITVYCLHPAPPSPTENQLSSERDAELIKVGRKIKKQSNPTIATGDLNDVAWSDTTLLFRKISGLLDPRIGRGLFNSYHAEHCYLRWPLDHLFHSNDFTLVKLQRLSYFGSDHFPLYCRLQYTPAAIDKQKAPTAYHEDKQWAEQKLAEGIKKPSSA